MALTEATHVHMPAQLRHIFAVMLLFDPPACSAQQLWDRHRLPLCEDFLAAARIHHNDPGMQLSAAMEDDALRHLQRIVGMLARHCQHWVCENLQQQHSNTGWGVQSKH